MINLAVLITEQHKLLSVAAILEVFETVNKVQLEKTGKEVYNINLVSLPSNTNISLYNYELHSIQSVTGYNLIIIPAFTTKDMKEALQINMPFIPWLMKQFGKGAEIATVCTGVFLLATTGLLNGKIATTHVDACMAFKQTFPNVKLQSEKTVTQDGNLFTSGGAISSFHLLLHIIKLHCGKNVAVNIAKIFAIDMDRNNQSYFSTFKPQKHHNDEIVASAQQKIEQNYQDSITIEEMIKDIPSSRRNIARRFKQATGITPIEYLQQTRISVAKKLLEQTGQQMNEVIYNTGYNDLKAFRKVFRKTVGMTPSEYREKFQPR